VGELTTAARRELAAAVGGSVAAGALALLAGGRTWAQTTVERQPPLPPVVDVLTGSDAAPLVPATGLVLLAAAVALLAVRSAGRVVVGLLMAVAGGVLGWSAIRVLAGSPASGEGTTEIAVAWPVLAVGAGLLGVAAGLLVVLRGRAWPGLGRRYERAPDQAVPERPQTDDDRAQAAWKALDRGEDPTA
jgi:uncharacterized membrane protein (TIGR02234 family)